MYTLYNLLKFLHIAAAMVWIGGACTLGIMNLRLARGQNLAAIAVLSQQSGFFGRAIIGPAAALTLVAGIVTAAQAGFDFGMLWITWGFAGVFGSMILGATLIRRTSGELNKLAQAASAEPRMSAVQRRLAILNAINLLVLLSTVWAMVFKPSL